jgi:hypothetical protein
MPPLPNVRDFTGDYYLEIQRPSVERYVMARWPSPGTLLELWSRDLNQRQRELLLIGGAVFHDPELLPMYADAVVSEDPRLRQAAAFGYRDLIADQLPNVRRGVSVEMGEALRKEIRAVAASLRVRSLPELWLDAALHPEGRSFTGQPGVILRRSPSVCLNALDTLFTPEDLNLYARALELSSSDKVRIGMVHFLEAATLQKFISRPSGPRDPVPHGLYVEAAEATELWLSRWCELDGASELEKSLGRLGARGVDPYASWSIDVWIHLLRTGPPQWWPTAALQLYRFGGPYYRLSVLRADSEHNDEVRRVLLRWYGQELGKESQTLPRRDPRRILPGPRQMPPGRGEP